MGTIEPKKFTYTTLIIMYHTILVMILWWILSYIESRARKPKYLSPLSDSLSLFGLYNKDEYILDRPRWI